MKTLLSLLALVSLVGCNTDPACRCKGDVPGGLLDLACGESVCLGGAGYVCVTASQVAPSEDVCTLGGPPVDTDLGSTDGAGPDCVPKTCAHIVPFCGLLSDGCGHTLDCGACTTCTPTTCAAAGQTCGTLADGCGHTLTCGGACPPPDVDDPELSNPIRESAQWECALPTATLASVNAWISAGAPMMQVVANQPPKIAFAWQWRTCNAQTGCTGWSYFATDPWDGEVYAGFSFDGAGNLHFSQYAWNSTVLKDKIVSNLEFQMNLDLENFSPIGVPDNHIRVVVRAPNDGCISLLSKIYKEAPNATGTWREDMYRAIGKRSDALDTDRHPIAEQVTDLPAACSGAPLSNAAILSHFASGSSTLFPKNVVSENRTRRCAAASQCSKWVVGGSTGWVLKSIHTLAAGGLAVDVGASSCPITNGTFACDGWAGVVTDNCVSARRTTSNTVGAIEVDNSMSALY